MIVNILIGTLIFGYAGWSLIKFVQKSKKGKCAACSLRETCQTSCSDLRDPNLNHTSIKKNR